MYKLLLVSDQEIVLNAFSQISNWELLGFKKPHIRHDLEGTKDSLQKHHADGIAIAVSPEEEKKIIQYLREQYPNLSIFQAGKNEEEIISYLGELKSLLNRIHADFSNDDFRAIDMLQVCRHDYFRKVISGQVENKEDLYRNMRLLRSRMDPDRECVLAELVQPTDTGEKLEGRWHYGNDRLEIALRNSFGGDRFGMHILPSVHPDGRVMVLACPLYDFPSVKSGEELKKQLEAYIQDGISHIYRYFGLELKIREIQVFPGLSAFCKCSCHQA